MSALFKTMPNKYTRFKISQELKRTSGCYDVAAGIILFNVRTQKASLSELPVRLATADFDGVEELYNILIDARKIDPPLNYIKLEKYVFVKHKGIDVSVSAYTKPSDQNHHGKKRLEVMEDASHFYISLPSNTPTQVTRVGAVPDWLLEPQPNLLQGQVVVAAPVHLVLPVGPAQGPAVQGPPQLVYTPAVDRLTRHDSHRGVVNLLQHLLNLAPLSNREVRNVTAGPQGTGYQNNPAWKHSVNRLTHPKMMTDAQFQSNFGLKKHHFYEFSTNTVAPALAAAGRPGRTLGTADTVAAVFLIKITKNPDFRNLALQLGCGKDTPRMWFWTVLHHLYDHSPILNQLRNLGNGNNLVDLLTEASNASHRCPRFMAYFGPLLAQWTANHPGQPAPRLVGLAGDGRIINIPHLSDFNKQQRTFSTKTKNNGLSHIVFVGMDGRAYFSFVLGACSSPANTDGEQCRFLVELENDPNLNLNGGMFTLLQGHPGFLVIFLLDKGFKRYLAGPGIDFLTIMQQIKQQTGGLVEVRLPLDAGDGYYDLNGNFHLPPIRHPQAPPNVQGLLMAKQANSTKLCTGAGRFHSEHFFATEWARQMLGGRDMIDQAYLNPMGVGVTPQVAKIYGIIQSHFDIQWRFQSASVQRCPLPVGCTYRQQAEVLTGRMGMENWLDPLYTGVPSGFNRLDMFARPRGPELRAALPLPGGVRMANLLDPNQTGFPHIPFIELYMIAGGPYSVNLVFKYMTQFQVRRCDRTLQYLGLINHVIQRQQPPGHMDGWIFDQIQAPAGWDAQENGPWEPVRIAALPALPSRYHSGDAADHVILVAYVPVNWPLQHPARGFIFPGAQRIKMACCGPRRQGKCKSGARTAPFCVHGITTIYAMGTLAHQPPLALMQVFRSTYRQLHIIDAAADRHYSADILQGLMN
jgi:hypothetical protein